MTAALYPEPRLLPAGDTALLVEVGEGIDETVNRTVHALTRALETADINGIVDLIPAYRSLLVCYDPLRLQLDVLRNAIGSRLPALTTDTPVTNRVVEIPTLYGGEWGPDLPFVANHNGISEDEVIAVHSSGTYVVFMMGFSPGFAYMGGMSPRIATPRLKTPRTSIPAGSVGIAQTQTGIYPVESPGGWQLIGRTPARMFDPFDSPPTLLRPGDKVRFVRIDEARYRELAAASEVQRSARESENPATIEVVEPGAMTTVQDLGRYGLQRYGVTVSGAMDTFALRVANLLVGNAENAAALEITITGPELRFLADATVAIAGGDLQPRLGDAAAPMWEAFRAPAGAVLSFRGLRSGARAYLAFAGGIDVPPILGSRSTYVRSRLGGFSGRRLAAGDRLSLFGQRSRHVRRLPPSWLPTYIGSHRLRVVPGPQAAAFTPAGLRTFVSSAYTISAQSDRMGYRLEGPRIEHRETADIVSDGTPAGAVQVAGDGQPLVLLADRGTTGGYSKIATVIGADLPRLAQSQAGDRVFFEAVTVEEAHHAYRRNEDFIARLGDSPTFDVAENI